MNLWDFVKIFLVLILLAGLLYSMLFLLKKYIYASEGKNPKLLNIKILSTQLLMPKKFVSVVKILDKVYILGVSDQSISLIDKLNKDEVQMENLESVSSVNFFDYLKKGLNRK